MFYLIVRFITSLHEYIRKTIEAFQSGNPAKIGGWFIGSVLGALFGLF